jgi:hypothetical protein
VQVERRLLCCHPGAIATLDNVSVIGYPLWLTDLDAPTARKSYFKMSKKIEKNILVYIWIFYVHSPSFTRKDTFLWLCKKDKFRCSKCDLHDIFSLFFTQATKNVFSPQTLVDDH